MMNQLLFSEQLSPTTEKLFYGYYQADWIGICGTTGVSEGFEAEYPAEQTQNNREEHDMALEWQFKRGDCVIVNIENTNNRYSILIEGQENNIRFYKYMSKYFIDTVVNKVMYVGARVRGEYQLIDHEPQPGEYVTKDGSTRLPASVLSMASAEAISDFAFTAGKNEFWKEVKTHERQGTTGPYRRT